MLTDNNVICDIISPRTSVSNFQSVSGFIIQGEAEKREVLLLPWATKSR